MNALARTRHKLHNSLVALLAVATVSAFGLVAVRPLPSAAAGVVRTEVVEATTATVPGTEVAVQATGDALEITVESAVQDLEAGAAAEPRKPRKPTRRSRQTLAMPYFSFAARS